MNMHYIDKTHILFNGREYTLFPKSGALSIGADPRSISKTLKELLRTGQWGFN